MLGEVRQCIDICAACQASYIYIYYTPRLTFDEDQPPASSLYLPTRMTALPPYLLPLPTLIHRLKLLLTIIIISLFILFRVLDSIVPSSGMQIHLILYQRRLGQLFRLNKRYRCTLSSILLFLSAFL